MKLIVRFGDKAALLASATRCAREMPLPFPGSPGDGEKAANPVQNVASANSKLLAVVHLPFCCSTGPKSKNRVAHHHVRYLFPPCI